MNATALFAATASRYFFFARDETAIVEDLR
jgi:hypothetical protein